MPPLWYISFYIFFTVFSVNLYIAFRFHCFLSFSVFFLLPLPVEIDPLPLHRLLFLRLCLFSSSAVSSSSSSSKLLQSGWRGMAKLRVTFLSEILQMSYPYLERSGCLSCGRRCSCGCSCGCGCSSRRSCSRGRFLLRRQALCACALGGHGHHDPDAGGVGVLAGQLHLHLLRLCGAAPHGVG